MIGLCRDYRALPHAGGLLEQPTWLLRAQAIVAAGRGESMAAPGDFAELAGLMEITG